MIFRELVFLRARLEQTPAQIYRAQLTRMQPSPKKVTCECPIVARLTEAVFSGPEADLKRAGHPAGELRRDAAIDDRLGDLVIAHFEQLFEDIFVVLADAG
jgi:hypothetical protein